MKKPINKISKYVKGKRLPSLRDLVREVSAGGVVYRRNKKGEVEILMIQDSKDRWAVPKGKLDKGESLRQAAEREIREETGLKEMHVKDWLGKVDFKFRRRNSLVLKTMHVFLVEAKGKTDDLKEEDVEWIRKAQWFSALDAFDQIEYDEIGKLILMALKRIRNNSKKRRSWHL